MESCREVLLTPFLTILLKLMELDDLTANDEWVFVIWELLEKWNAQETNASVNSVLQDASHDDREALSN